MSTVFTKLHNTLQFLNFFHNFPANITVEFLYTLNFDHHINIQNLELLIVFMKN